MHRFLGVVLALGVVAGTSGQALSQSNSELRRPDCWTANFDGGSKRVMCFKSNGRMTMTNENVTTDNKGWSTCNFSGDYLESGSNITVTFGPRTGRCTNGAMSPQFVAVCDYSGDSLSCRGSSIVDGKTYPFVGTFE